MLIGLCGYQQSGKDTVANYLVVKYDYVRVSFADKLKEAVAALFDCTRDQVDEFKTSKELVTVSYYNGDHILNITWRAILQRMGTEVGREIFGPDFWVEQVDISNPKTVLTDCRFPNEFAHVLDNAGKLILIDRPGFGPRENHASEAIPTDVEFITIHNNNSLDHLYLAVDQTMEYLLHGWVEE